MSAQTQGAGQPADTADDRAAPTERACRPRLHQRHDRLLAHAAVALALCLGLTGCATSRGKAESWQWLIQRDARGWHNVGKTTLDPRWQVHDGELMLTGAGGGDIVSDAQYGDFELELEWQLAAGGNSGLFYRAQDSDPVYQRAVEYQLLDDARAQDRFDPKHRAGAAYDLIAPQGATLRPDGSFNHARVVACGRHVSHWLNGHQVAEYTLASDDWQTRLAASKFAAQPDFAAAGRGHLGLQDHGAVLRVRNARIRNLVGCG